MENKINIAELLKDCPKGMELNCTMYDNVEFDYVEQSPESAYPIHCLLKINGGYNTLVFTHNGCNDRHPNSKCVIFPKGKTTWEGFQRPFKDGDILSYQYEDFTNRTIYIYMQHSRMNTTYYVALSGNFDSKFMINDKEEYALNGYNDSVRLATEEEKEKLFQAIKDNGYRWNAETKTLEKLSKFKVGDKIVKKDNPTECWYVQGIDTYRDSYYYIVTKGKVSNLYFKDQDKWELAPVPKFKVGDIVETKRNKLFDYKIIKITDTHYTLESITGANTYDILICEDENWKLVPDKFDINTLKPFDKVLVRDDNKNKWSINFWGFYDIKYDINYPYECCGNSFAQCIPYEGNELLLGTTDDCDEYYKTW